MLATVNVTWHGYKKQAIKSSNFKTKSPWLLNNKHNSHYEPYFIKKVHFFGFWISQKLKSSKNTSFFV